MEMKSCLFPALLLVRILKRCVCGLDVRVGACVGIGIGMGIPPCVCVCECARTRVRV